MKQRFNIYKTCVRPVLFSLDAENAHCLVHKAAKYSQYSSFTRNITKRFFNSKESTMLSSNLFGCEFSNPIGIAAGFDKNAELIDFIYDLGFGFVEVGSVTHHARAGNQKPRLFRLPDDRALINRLGLNNAGASAVIENIQKRSSLSSIPIGISVAKTHDPKLHGRDAINDIVQCFETVEQQAKYIVLNISCPNTKEGKTFEEIDSLRNLLESVQEKRVSLNSHTPLLVKLSPDISLNHLEDAITTCEDFSVDGYVLSNTSTERSNLCTPISKLNPIGAGGLSGKPIFARSVERVSFVYKMLSGSKPIIGVGGIDSGACAYEYIKAGASLIELYSSLIYEGPGIANSIKTGLVDLLKQDGFSHISQAVGTVTSQKVRVKIAQ